ncbi:hypothetical protein [Gracilibacillus dipsosauri]|uniref:hypothetical protein n=1 Tax=Gracilibacillus dipsosauri TaxID=178340 RepID=UPI0015E84415|nr:hypothetical protein [Gracilibacillus dipsosauri]
MQYYYNPEVKYLLLTEAYHKEKILYAHNSKPFEAPMIGPRPPFYCNPIYQSYYPII